MSDRMKRPKMSVNGYDICPKADLYRADLSEANLHEADLRWATLHEANLYRSVLSGADLYRANLSGATLRGATLHGANLREANLCRANLCGADLYGAYLYGANLRGTNLCQANLSGATLRGALNIPSSASASTRITPDGDLIVWKKAGKHLVQLRIPKEAKRSNATGRKCRAEWAEVLHIEGADKAVSKRGGVYRVGETVHPDAWDDDRWNECSHGIHFFLTREEAEAENGFA